MAVSKTNTQFLLEDNLKLGISMGNRGDMILLPEPEEFEIHFPSTSETTLTQGGFFVPITAPDDLEAVVTMSWSALTEKQLLGIRERRAPQLFYFKDPLDLHMQGYLKSVDAQTIDGRVSSDGGVMYNVQVSIQVVHLKYPDVLAKFTPNHKYVADLRLGFKQRGYYPLTVRSSGDYLETNSDGWAILHPQDDYSQSCLEITKIPDRKGSIFFAWKPSYYPTPIPTDTRRWYYGYYKVITERSKESVSVLSIPPESLPNRRTFTVCVHKENPLPDTELATDRIEHELLIAIEEYPYEGLESAAPEERGYRWRHLLFKAIRLGVQQTNTHNGEVHLHYVPVLNVYRQDDSEAIHKDGLGRLLLDWIAPAVPEFDAPDYSKYSSPNTWFPSRAGYIPLISKNLYPDFSVWQLYANGTGITFQIFGGLTTEPIHFYLDLSELAGLIHFEPVYLFGVGYDIDNNKIAISVSGVGKDQSATLYKEFLIEDLAQRFLNHTYEDYQDSVCVGGRSMRDGVLCCGGILNSVQGDFVSEHYLTMGMMAELMGRVMEGGNSD